MDKLIPEKNIHDEIIDNSTSEESNEIIIIEDSIKLLKSGDAGAHWKPAVIEAARILFSTNKAEFYRLRSAIKSAHHEAQITNWIRAVKQSDEADNYEQNSKSDELINLAKEHCELFHDEQGACYATFEQNSHYETWALGSKGFNEWLSYKAYFDLEFSPSTTTFASVLTTLKGIATHEGSKQKVYIRCAPTEDGFLIDQTNDRWSAIQVTSRDWKIIENPGIKFIRSNSAEPLPDPVDGDFSLFFSHVNIPEKDKSLVIAFIIESWRINTPYVHLELSGEQGSAKSTTHQRIRQLSDPNRIPLRTAPKDVQDIFISAANNHQASFENMSILSGKMQDALCTLSTGGGFSTRKLYSDADESVIEVKRPAIMNCISPIATRPDLIDRVIHIDLPKLSNGYKPMEELDKDFEDSLPSILGGLLTIIVKTLKVLPSVKIDCLPRMADFVLLGQALHKVLGNEELFIDAYKRNRGESLRRSLESSPAAVAIQELVNKEGSFTGTLKDLKSKLDNFYHQYGEGWPRSPKGLADALRRTAPALNETGISIEFLGHRRDGSYVAIQRIHHSKNKDHDDHTVTGINSPSKQTKRGDDVMDVTVDFGKIKNPEADYLSTKDPEY